MTRCLPLGVLCQLKTQVDCSSLSVVLALHAAPFNMITGHKGYCVPEHVEAIRKHGPCAVHRRTFAPIKTWFPVEQPDAQVAEGDDKPRQKRKSGKKTAPKK